MKSTGYWVSTALIAFETLAGGVMDLAHGRTMLVIGPPVVEIVTHLGYPVYFLAILGFWKVLGAVALVVPRFPRLKEWAYAGIFFELTGAAASLAAHGDPARELVAPLVLAALAVASWCLRPPDRTLLAIAPTRIRV